MRTVLKVPISNRWN